MRTRRCVLNGMAVGFVYELPWNPVSLVCLACFWAAGEKGAVLMPLVTEKDVLFIVSCLGNLGASANSSAHGH